MPEEKTQHILEAPNGPWIRLVTAKWGTYPISIYQNQDRILLATLFDMADEEIKGMVVLMRRVLVYEGDLSKIVSTQNRELVLLEKIAPTGKLSYLFVASTPAYISYSEEEFVEEVKKQYTELSALESWARELLEGYGVKAKAFVQASDEQTQSLLGDPYIVFALLNPKATPVRTPFAIPKILLGRDVEGKDVEILLDSLESCVVTGGERERRLHAMHVMVEAVLQANVPCIVFDASKAFSGLAALSKDIARLQEYKMPPRSIAFPFKSYELGKTLFVDFSLVSGDSFLEAFVLEDSDVAEVIKKVYEEKRRELSSPQDLVTALNAVKESKEAPQYLINKAVRVASVIQRAHQGMFGKTVATELFTPWQESVGRIFYVDLSQATSLLLKRLVIKSLLEAILLPQTKELRLLLAFEEDASILSEDIALVQKRFSGKGVGFVFQASHEVDVEAVKEPKLKLEVVGSEVVATEFGQKPKRLSLKPVYTECSELFGKQAAAATPAALAAPAVQAPSVAPSLPSAPKPPSSVKALPPSPAPAPASGPLWRRKR